MKLTKSMVNVICDLEYIVGNQCYNPSSYNGYTGEEGCNFKYPVYFYQSEDDKEPIKTRFNINDIGYKIDTKTVSTMKYKFGANHLFIGDGIIEVMNYLENRYGLDFNELEKSLKNKDY